MANHFNKADINTIFGSFTPDPIQRKAICGFLIDSILVAHTISHVGWVLYEVDGGIVLSVRNVYTVSFHLNFSGQNISGVALMIANSLLDQSLRMQLEQLGCSIGGGFKNTGGSNNIVIPSGNAESFVKALALVRPAHNKYISNVLRPGKKTNWPKLYNPKVMQYLRAMAPDRNIPDPAYYNITPPPPPPPGDPMIIDQIDQYMQSYHLYFSKLQIASFYTALQTKGFVILSGISGSGKTKLAQRFVEMLPGLPDAAKDGEPSNCEFISVRPDWRDSKSLLGYYNPLTKRYEWTNFLRFLRKVSEDYKNGQKLAWFLILDEMNLARVEYYFADLLSVLESGRSVDGYTKEPLTFQFGLDAVGDIPPEKMRLPPNLYIVGTVNVDETTQSFSPKVLDRAFSLEFVDVDLKTYGASLGIEQEGGQELADELVKELHRAFTRDGNFALIDKDAIAGFVKTHSTFVDRLQALNVSLRPYNMHFGYRVFDEIMMFLHNAEQNQFEGYLDPAVAFDQAVLMKVLPKFHGSRGKLEKPLGAVLGWCLVNKNDLDLLKNYLADPTREFQRFDWHCPDTACRILRMFQDLNSTGFASFG